MNYKHRVFASGYRAERRTWRRRLRLKNVCAIAKHLDSKDPYFFIINFHRDGRDSILGRLQLLMTPFGFVREWCINDQIYTAEEVQEEQTVEEPEPETSEQKGKADAE